MKIKIEDIKYAEEALLPNGCKFDDERINFITNFKTVDLQAVPGSGKTTALLAKLLILERYLPFEDGSGILVLSHTNAAIDEIRHKIEKFCPKLFSYPNFVGTIQSFVDKFLAEPYYSKCYNKHLIRIDNEIYLEKLEYHLSYCIKGEAYATFKKVSHIKNANYGLLQKYRFDTDQSNKIILISEINGTELNIAKSRGNTKQENYIDYKSSEKQQIRSYLIKLKSELLKEGILHFDDAYFLAKCYLQKLPKIKILLQKRFSYVFVDEMQDLDIHQYELLEQIFFDKGNSHSKYQRIGDKNQAIYSGDAKLLKIWNDRAEVLKFEGSPRLSLNIANVVQAFAIEPIVIEGLRKNQDGSKIDIKPILIIYDDDTKESVIPKFANIIKVLQLEGKIPNTKENEYHVIAWNTVWEKEEDKNNKDKIRLTDYYPSFSREENRPKIDYETLDDYLVFFDKEKKTLAAIRKNILNAFFKIMRLEGIYDENSRAYTIRKLINFLSNSHDEAKERAYEKFKLNFYQFCIGIIRDQKDIVFNRITTYMPEFLRIFGNECRVNKSKSFMMYKQSFHLNDAVASEKNERREKQNRSVIDEIEIKIGSVHSAKGQTHTATLYLESYFHSDGKDQDAKSYESQRLKDQFQSINLTNSAKVRVKQSAKMVYVGFSRPTHLLCFAVHKKRFGSCLNCIDTEKWKIERICSE